MRKYRSHGGAGLINVLSILGLTLAVAGCLSSGGDSGNSGSASASASTPASSTITHTVGANTYTWNVTCGGADCLVGSFVGGDYWIAPKNPGDQVVLKSVTTTGTDAGLVINPSAPASQGFLSCWVPNLPYDASVDKRSSLPMNVAVNSSLVKATSKTACTQGTNPSPACCIDSYGVLTVLSTAPPNNGTDALRPGMAGASKTIYRLADFDLTQIPSEAAVSTAASTDFQASSFATIHTRWHTPYVDNYQATIGDNARALVPTGLPDYGADQGSRYLSDLIRIMGTDLLSAKTPAITGLLQRGVDLYASYKAGIMWQSGAGQQVGRKPPVAFFGALITNAAIKTEIAGLAGTSNDLFQEDGQIHINTATGNIAVWGDDCTENTYWANLFAGKYYAGAIGPVNPSGDNFRICKDPYGWIDGPGGLPGTFYMSCCSTGPFIGFQTAQSLMPALCTANNNIRMSQYTRRVVNTGLRTSPDQCAPPDPAEAANCDPFTNGANCNFYKVTWGPDPANPGNCIPNGGGQNGRFPALNATPLPDPILREPNISSSLRGSQTNALLNACN